MTRLIRFYDKKNDEFVGEVILPNCSLKLLQLLYDFGAANPMYDCYHIDETKGAFLKNKYGFEMNFDFDVFDYFLEYDDK